MHGDNIKNVRNFYMYLNNGAGGYIVYRKAGKGKYSKLAYIDKNTILSYTDKSAKMEWYTHIRLLRARRQARQVTMRLTAIRKPL